MARTRLQRTGELVLRGSEYYVRYRLAETDDKGKRPRVYHHLGSKKLGLKEIQRLQRDFMASRDPWLVRPNSSTTFGEFVKQRFETDVYPTLTLAGREHYEYILTRHILPTMARIRLRDLNGSHVQAVINSIVGKKLSWQTAEHARVAIGAVLRHAKPMQAWFGDIPTEFVRMPPKRVKERRALTWEEALKLSQATKEPVSTMVLVLVLTGLRIGELLGLRWKRLRLGENPHLEIVETFTKGRWKADTKNGKSRIVPFPAWLLPRLLAMKTELSTAEHPVFMGKTGKPFDAHNYLADYLKPAAIRLTLLPEVDEDGVVTSTVDWHTLRHTFASWTDGAGLSQSQRMELLGHSTPSMTQRYTHPDWDKIRKALEGMPRIQ